MVEDIETEEQEQTESLWEILQREQAAEESDDDETPYQAEQEEQDEEAAKQDKLTKKLSAKMDNMQRKFEQTMLRERIAKFEDSADELTLDMFKTVASDVKSLEDFDKALSVVNKQAAQLRKQAEEYKAKLEQQAAQETAAAWGTGPIGTPNKRTVDEVEARQKKIASGDTNAALAALLEGDSMVGNIL